MNRILIVDPEAGPRASLEQIFADRGDEVRYASGATDALDLLETYRPSVVLCAATRDPVLGGDGGAAALCSSLRDRLPAERLAVVVYSRVPLSAASIEAALAAGAGAVVGPDQIQGITSFVDAELRRATILRRARESITQFRDEAQRLEREAVERTARIVGEHASDPGVVANELVAAHPDGALVVAPDGRVVTADLGARELLGRALIGRPVASIVPGSRLASVLGGGTTAERERFSFDVESRSDRAARRLQATVEALHGKAVGDASDEVLRLVLLVDLDRRGPVEAAVRGLTSRVPDEYHQRLLGAARAHFALDRMPRRSAASQRLHGALEAAARQLQPALLRGPLGSGRRRCAEILHHAAGASGPLLELGCDGLAEVSQDVELFGDPLPSGDRSPGLVARATDGTLVLLDVEHLSFAMQARIAAVARDPHVRIVATTSASTDALVQSGRMLPEFARAFAGSVIDVPPLRERREDLPEMIARTLGREDFSRLTVDALRALVAWEWPGGFPEFHAQLDRIASRRGDVVQVGDLDPEIERHAALHGSERRLRDVELSPFASIPAPLPSVPEPAEERAALPAAVRTRSGAWIPEREDWIVTEDDPIDLEVYQQKALLRALFESKGNRTLAAEILGVGKSTLYRKMSKWGFTGEGG